MTTFHVLIATIGRPSLRIMLDSLKEELSSQDYLTIVFDGDKAMETSGFSKDWVNDHKSQITVIEQIPNLGFGGHGIRTKYQGTLQPTTFIMHADDDDMYIKGSFDKLRTLCTDPNTLYIARMDIFNEHFIPRPYSTSIRIGDIGTPNGIIPFGIANKSSWANTRVGDGEYYMDLVKHVDHIVFLNIVIYRVKPPNSRALCTKYREVHKQLEDQKKQQDEVKVPLES
jgi:hypothetical protein